MNEFRPEDTGAAFPNTQWSLVMAAGSTEHGRNALEALCRNYWPPLYAFLRRDGYTREEAQDLVQGFLARILSRGDLARVMPERGRLRSYLLGALRNFLVDDVRHERAQKRGGGSIHLSLDAEDGLAATVPDSGKVTPEEAFDRRWAALVLSRAIERLRAEQEAAGRGEILAALLPAVTGAGEGGYRAIAERFALTENNLGIMVHRWRQRLRGFIRDEVTSTTSTPEEAGEELRHLMDILRQS